MADRSAEMTGPSWEFPPLRRAALDSDPFTQLGAWLSEAREQMGSDADAFSLATVGPEGRPASRMVLLKGFSEAGLVFLTNLRSSKSRHLLTHPFAAAGFWWRQLGRQLRVEGRVESAGKEESDRLFAARPRESQLAAWASPQSEALSGRDELEARVQEFRSRFEGKEMERPPFWGGLRIVPDAWEFWQGQENRQHDRFRYSLNAEGKWDCQRLAP